MGFLYNTSSPKARSPGHMMEEGTERPEDVIRKDFGETLSSG